MAISFLAGRRRPVALAFNHASISAALQGWYRSDSSDLTALNHDDAIASWADQSGLGRDLAQGTATIKPIYKETADLTPRLKPTVYFEGGDSPAGAQMTSNAFADVANTNGYTVYLHFNQISLDTPGLDGQIALALGPLQMWASTNTTEYTNANKVGVRGFGGANETEVADGLTGWQTLTFVFNPPSTTGPMRVYRNNVQIGADGLWTLATSDCTAVTISGNASQNLSLYGQVAAWGWYSAAHDHATRAGLVEYVGQTYGR